MIETERGETWLGVHVWDRVGLGGYCWGKPGPAAALREAQPLGGESGVWDSAQPEPGELTVRSACTADAACV